MSDTDTLTDLAARIDRGVEYLSETIGKYPDSAERLRGKVEGLLLVKDWLRSYPARPIIDPAPGPEEAYDDALIRG